MKRITASICRVLMGVGFGLICVQVEAQPSPQAMILSALSDCIKDAINRSTAELDGEAFSLSCVGDKAKTLYNFLGDKVRVEIVVDRNGKFENRQFGNNACYHQIEDPSGTGADEFRCDLLLIVGGTLSQ